MASRSCVFFRSSIHDAFVSVFRWLFLQYREIETSPIVGHDLPARFEPELFQEKHAFSNPLLKSIPSSLSPGSSRSRLSTDSSPPLHVIWMTSLMCLYVVVVILHSSFEPHSSRLLQYCDSSAIFIFMFSYIMRIHHEGLKPYSLIFKMSWCPSYLRKYDSFCLYPSPWNHSKDGVNLRQWYLSCSEWNSCGKLEGRTKIYTAIWALSFFVWI